MIITTQRSQTAIFKTAQNISRCGSRTHKKYKVFTWSFLLLYLKELISFPGRCPVILTAVTHPAYAQAIEFVDWLVCERIKHNSFQSFHHKKQHSVNYVFTWRASTSMLSQFSSLVSTLSARNAWPSPAPKETTKKRNGLKFSYEIPSETKSSKYWRSYRRKNIISVLKKIC